MERSELFNALGETLKDRMYAHVLETQWHRSRIQNRHRPERSCDVEYTPFEEVRDQDNDSVRQDNSSGDSTGDT